jgi:hypothetical protein
MDPITTAPTNPADTTAASDDDATVVSGAKSVEEVEAFWRNRVSLKDRAHAAERKALRDQLESLKATPGTGQQGGDDSAAEVERLRRELAAKDALYDRKVKYPNLVANGISDSTLSAADEGELARLNSLFDDDQARGTFIAPTAPRKPAPTAPKTYADMTKDELLVELERAATQDRMARRGY